MRAGLAALFGAGAWFAHMHYAPLAHVEGDRLVLRSSAGVQSVSMLDGGRTGLYYDFGELAGELRPRARNVLLLGLGGGEMLRAARRTLPHALLVGVDNDASAVAAAYSDFGIARFGAFGVQADAWEYLSGRPDASVDVLMVDVFDDDRLPERFRSARFFALARRKLGRGGLLMMNVSPLDIVLDVSTAMAAGGMKFAGMRFSVGEAVLLAEP